MATHGGQQPWTARLEEQRAGVTAGISATGQLPDSTAREVAAGQLPTAQAQGNTAGLSVVRQVPDRPGQLATGQLLGSSPEPLPRCAKQQHTFEPLTQSVAALQRIAKTVPSWAATTLPDHPGAPDHHGFLASAVMLETLGRQKQTQALSLHASSPKEKGAMEPKQSKPHRGSRQGLASPGEHEGVNPGRRGQGGSRPESPISHKWVIPPCCAMHYACASLLSAVHQCVSISARKRQFLHAMLAFTSSGLPDDLPDGNKAIVSAYSVQA